MTPTRREFMLASLAATSASRANEKSGFEMIELEGEARRYWPRWRGPSGQGLVEGEGFPDRWSATENVVWQIDVPGDGNSAPVVWGDHIFLTTAYDAGRRRSILAFDRKSGKQLWESFAPEADPKRVHRKNGYASAAPTTDGERVYAYFGGHGLLIVDFEGKQVWHRDFGEINAYHGTACSPLLHGSAVILYQDHRGPGGSFAVALDRRSGNTIWHVDRSERVGWGSPVAVRADGREEIIVSSYRRVYSYDPGSGETLWSCGGNLVEVIPSPVAGRGLLFCCSGRAGPTLAIRSGGDGDITDTHVAWRTGKGSPFVPSPLIYGEYLYMVNDMVSVATCYHAASGKLMWQGRLGEPISHGFSASPVGVDGKVYFTNDLGETYVLAAGPEFKLLHVNTLDERMLASPALVEGRWYLRTARRLLAVG